MKFFIRDLLENRSLLYVNFGLQCEVPIHYPELERKDTRDLIDRLSVNFLDI